MLHAVIMAGGSGTRLWPESRARRPKQLLSIQGQRTMIQATVDRLGDLVSPEQVLVATTEALAGAIHEQLPFLPRESILCEPCPRNTAPCIGLAAVYLLRSDPEATMAVMPADHVIEPAERFREAIRFGVSLVEECPERLITFGVRPTYPAETFGYIERDQALEAGPGAPGAGELRAYRVKRFHEKPKAEAAREYLAAGRFYWNAGIFVWKARTILDALARFEPEIHQRLERIGAAADAPDFREVLDREFAAIQGISIDYAVMERAAEVAVVEASFDWDDVGSWRSLERLNPPDQNGNVIAAGKHLEIRAGGNIVRASDPKHAVVLVGVEDLVVVATDDVTLVANKHDEESVRQVIQALKDRGWEEYL